MKLCAGIVSGLCFCTVPCLKDWDIGMQREVCVHRWSVLLLLWQDLLVGLLVHGVSLPLSREEAL